GTRAESNLRPTNYRNLRDGCLLSPALVHRVLLRPLCKEFLAIVVAVGVAEFGPVGLSWHTRGTQSPRISIQGWRRPSPTGVNLRQSTSTLALAVSPACGYSSTRQPVASWPGPSSVAHAVQEKSWPVTVISPVPSSGLPLRKCPSTWPVV